MLRPAAVEQRLSDVVAVKISKPGQAYQAKRETQISQQLTALIGPHVVQTLLLAHSPELSWRLAKCREPYISPPEIASGGLVKRRRLIGAP